MNVYKLNEAIKVRFQALGGQTGITDLQLITTNPSGTNGSPITLTELSNGLYEASWTPNVVGRWLIKITSVLYPENGASESYYIGDQNADYNVIIGATGNQMAVNDDGALSVVVIGGTNKTPVQIKFEADTPAVNSNEWQDLVEYTVPNGYDYYIVKFEGYSEVAGESIRAIVKTIAGSYDSPTNTFTDDDNFITPKFASEMYLYVTSQIGNANDTVTITYTNQDGTTGRTATVGIPKGSLIGTALNIVLQTGDYGIMDITNITHTATGQAGAFTVYMTLDFFYLLLKTSSTQYRTGSLPIGCFILEEGASLSLQYFSKTKSTYIRRANLCGNLVPRSG